MNSLPPPPGELPPPVSDEAWELASAYLDNEVTPAERAQVEASPLLLLLVAQLAPNRETLRQAAPVSGREARDAALAEALRIFDVDAANTAPPSAVGSLDQARTQRKARSNRWFAPLAAAAGIAVVVGLGATVLGKGAEQKQTSKVAPVNASPATTSAATTAALATKAADANATAATTAAPKGSFAETTTAPAATTAAATASTTTTKPLATAGSGTTTVPAKPVQGDSAVSANEVDDLRRLVANSQPFLPEACSAPLEAPLAVATLVWRGEQATAFTNDQRTVVVVVIDATCARSATTSL
jgi:trimeric autotransporter adhesin